ncbi:macro domain-containing protein [Natronorubrum aibiense]|nr:macro domain-containing protein [Natronorubrum aibiense]
MTAETPEDFPHFCSICGRSFDYIPHKTYPNPVCDNCDSRAVSEPGTPTQYGDNPVFIDGIRCFRRYKEGAWLTLRDPTACDDYEEFYDTHYDDSGPIHTFNQPDPPTEGNSIRQFSEVRGSSEDQVIARVIEGDILNQSADALICGITTDPSLDGGVAGAVCDASEHSLRPLVQNKAPFTLGDAVVTGGFDLPYSYLIFVAATPAKAGKRATEGSVQRAVKNGLHYVADLRLPSVVLPLIGAGAGGLSTQSTASAIASGIRASSVSPPVCVRVVTQNPRDQDAVQNELSVRGSNILNQEYSDPLEGQISAQLERINQSDSPSNWEIYPWISFDPYTGDINDYDDREDIDHHTPPRPTKDAIKRIEDPLSDFGKDYGNPEQWFAWYDGFNSQLGGIRAAIDHPQLARQLYSREQSLIGILRGLEHEDSEYSDILELVLDTPSSGKTNEIVARIRYRVSGEYIETSNELTDLCLQTSLRILEYTVETLSHLDFDHPMSNTMEVDPVDRIEVIVHAYSQVAFELSIPMDLAEDVVYSNLSTSALCATATYCENHLD